MYLKINQFSFIFDFSLYLLIPDMTIKKFDSQPIGMAVELVTGMHHVANIPPPTHHHPAFLDIQKRK
jgi:hypothetical protein